MEEIMEKKQFAVLIDSDNVSADYASSIFKEIENYGYASYRRIYGNWSKKNGWKEEILLENSITPIQQFNYTTGKNATDMAMVIDAMDILYSGKVDGFCLVTSDSDFTRLAMRLREANMYVIGMGESKTPMALTKACNKFIHLNLISANEKEKADVVTPIYEIEEAVISFVNDNENRGRTTYLGEVGSKLNSRFTDFDVRNYGYTKLVVFLKDKCEKLRVTKEATSYIVELKEQTDKELITKEILCIIKENKGLVNNLSVIQNELIKKHGKFDIKDYGYSRFSSFLRSIEEISVNGNSVKCKKSKKGK